MKLRFEFYIDRLSLFAQVYETDRHLELKLINSYNMEERRMFEAPILYKHSSEENYTVKDMKLFVDLISRWGVNTIHLCSRPKYCSKVLDYIKEKGIRWY